MYKPFIAVILAGLLWATPVKAQEENMKTAIFAGGCFWCMESEFASIDEGISSVVSGYSGGESVDPTYQQVSSGRSGHREVIQVTYDPAKVDYWTLLEVFWRNIDPFDAQGQFCDKGDQYRAAIYVNDDEERMLAEKSKAKMEENFGKPVVTEILDAKPFYKAEDYHQEYYKKNALRYKMYRNGCGRDDRLEDLWDK